MTLAWIKTNYESQINELINYLDSNWTVEKIYKKLIHFENNKFKTSPFFNHNQLKTLFNLMLIKNSYQKRITKRVLEIILKKDVLEWIFIDALIRFYVLVLTYDDVWQEYEISDFAMHNNIIDVDKYFQNYLDKSNLKSVRFYQNYIKKNIEDLQIKKNLLDELKDLDCDYITIDFNTLTITKKVYVSDINLKYKDYVIEQFITMLEKSNQLVEI
ncbi:hypothetical protein I7634_04435 [Mycoplasma mycoides subsp. capri]|uniref:hypothetical protein n=1 Tax=Mycoplasma mycoides TaxID=2102 RepID=UPI00224059F0|nr:hypothetical protein [Mycoplasma mycoides]QVJ96293.1 hypothetical protein I7632_04790 [Mycoplasma mycoides subsp. capri]QVJ97192.1 hypothetical protein I7633_04740 [Mycoplasma mycoides subsp. capri]QVK00176.1 hypothetical protein I7634_04435 [Mycoplasma mycoides subsp. capri]QVK01059.1 hypothetical protein I7635_04750 [Mycoplasma mycoides subsp. capri]